MTAIPSRAMGVACQEGLFSRAVRVTITVAGLVLNQVLIMLIILVVASSFTALQRMVHVWRMTGGEAGGWQPPQKPFITPGMAVQTDRPDLPPVQPGGPTPPPSEDDNTGDEL